MLSFPLKTCDLTTDWMEGLHTLTSTSFGEACAKACLESSSALRQAQKLAAKAKLSTENEASQAVEALLNYYHILLRLEAPLGADAHDRRVLSIQWRSAWDGAAKFKVLSGIVSGMHYLHSLEPPVLHRNLKTQNLLIDEGGRVT